MKRIALVFALALTVGLTAGCDWKHWLATPQEKPEAAEKLDRVAAQVADIAEIVRDSVQKAEPVADALEEATGKQLDPESVERAEAVTGKLENIVNNLRNLSTAAAAAPGPQQPYATGIAAILGALGTVLGAVRAFANGRKAKKSAEVASALADRVPGGGAAVQDMAAKKGVSREINDAFLRAHPAGSAPSASAA